ncbi:hypothetical protein M8C17_03565 [Micromonospora sp. RHAY321]|uniref:CU044_2847 family protein n=1 Tax=Micromonospora sp. RHAY321 TaxID=2944807 RepID=UPI00207D24A0|nr:CU044_2847 family protein [Micromonospora sp. RHAY321]MCO1594233.1 hypothetical protein [Micromonospora sp. RHAY321]
MPQDDELVEKSWVEVRLPSGRTVMLRSLDEAPAAVGEDTGTVQDVRFRAFDFRRLTATLQEVGDLVKGAIETLTPTEAEVELGLGFSAKSGQILVLFGDAAVDASMKVTLKWSFDQRSDSDDEA